MNAEVDIKLDQKIGDFFLPQLQDAKHRLWIMSPWVATEYMELALKKKNEGLNVRVTTSNDFSKDSQIQSLSKLLERQTRVTKEGNRKLVYIGVGLAIFGVLLIRDTQWTSLVFSVIGLILFFIGRKKIEPHWISKLGEDNLTVLQYHMYKMVHAKIYIVDDTVIMGSANLTGNGIHRNTEVMATIKSDEVSKKLIEAMKDIQKISGLDSVPYDVIGDEIEYAESRESHYRRRWRIR